MKQRRGRPPKHTKLDADYKIRMTTAEKAIFREAADAAGIPLSIWIRERLRQVALHELAEVARVRAWLDGEPRHGRAEATLGASQAARPPASVSQS